MLAFRAVTNGGDFFVKQLYVSLFKSRVNVSFFKGFWDPATQSANSPQSCASQSATVKAISKSQLP